MSWMYYWYIVGALGCSQSRLCLDTETVIGYPDHMSVDTATNDCIGTHFLFMNSCRRGIGYSVPQWLLNDPELSGSETEVIKVCNLTGMIAVSLEVCIHAHIHTHTHGHTRTHTVTHTNTQSSTHTHRVAHTHIHTGSQPGTMTSCGTTSCVQYELSYHYQSTSLHSKLWLGTAYADIKVPSD